MAGRHRKARGYTPKHTGSYVGKRRKKTSDGLFGGVFGRLRPSWTPPGGYAKSGAPGVFPGRRDMWGGTVVRHPSNTYRSSTSRTNQLFGSWT